MRVSRPSVPALPVSISCPLKRSNVLLQTFSKWDDLKFWRGRGISFVIYSRTRAFNLFRRSRGRETSERNWGSRSNKNYRDTRTFELSPLPGHCRTTVELCTLDLCLIFRSRELSRSESELWNFLFIPRTFHQENFYRCIFVRGSSKKKKKEKKLVLTIFLRKRKNMNITSVSISRHLFIQK